MVSEALFDWFCCLQNILMATQRLLIGGNMHSSPRSTVFAVHCSFVFQLFNTCDNRKANPSDIPVSGQGKSLPCMQVGGYKPYVNA